eukprot:4986935-Prymnesium_polylepis.1
MLELRPCASAELAQRWVYNPVTQAFRSAEDDTTCLRYFAEAASFAAWACSDGNAAEERFAVERLPVGPSQRQFCATMPDGSVACVTVVD